MKKALRFALVISGGLVGASMMLVSVLPLWPVTITGARLLCFLGGMLILIASNLGGLSFRRE